jgi:hypothetical protein
MFISEGPVRRIIRLCFGGLSAVGLAISLWAQAVAIAGLDPREYFHQIWIVEPSLTGVVLPLASALVRNGIRHNPFDLPRRPLMVILWLLGYYVFQFYRFLYRAAIYLRSSDAWQMFSAGWIVLFALATIYYLKPRPETPSLTTESSRA